MKKNVNKLKSAWLGAVCMTLLWTACNQTENPNPLYNRIGGVDTIGILMDSFLVKVAADTVINSYFTPTFNDPIRTLNFKNHLINQLCQATGGPCVYTGKTMTVAHQGMMITDEEYNAILDDMKDALNTLPFEQDEKDEIIAILENYREDIIHQ